MPKNNFKIHFEKYITFTDYNLLGIQSIIIISKRNKQKLKI